MEENDFVQKFNYSKNSNRKQICSILGITESKTKFKNKRSTQSTNIHLHGKQRSR